MADTAVLLSRCRWISCRRVRSSPPCAAVSEALHSRRMRICFLTGPTTILLLYSSELFVSLVHTTIKVDTEFAQIKSGQLIQHNYESCKPAAVGLSEIFSTPPPRKNPLEMQKSWQKTLTMRIHWKFQIDLYLTMFFNIFNCSVADAGLSDFLQPAL